MKKRHIPPTSRPTQDRKAIVPVDREELPRIRGAADGEYQAMAGD